MYLYIHCMYTYIQCTYMFSQQQFLVGILEVYPCMYTMVDSSTIAFYTPMSKAVQDTTGEYAVATTRYHSSGICIQYMVPMYNICMLYVHVYAMYVHVLISCLNSHSEGVYRRYIPVCTQW